MALTVASRETAIAADEGRLLPENAGMPEGPAVAVPEVGLGEESLPPSTPP